MRLRRDWGRKRQGWIKIGLGAVVVIIIAAGSFFWQYSPEDEKSWSWSIGNQVILIDAGHGGVDPGAVGKISLEKDITLNISKHLQLLIQQAGGNPVMVRVTDVDLGTSQGLAKRKREDLAQRIQLAKDSKADVYLSIHVNSSPNHSLTGPQVFYHTNLPGGKMLAEAIQAELNKLAGTKRVAKDNQDLFILKKADQAAVTIEVGFLSNPQEEAKLNETDYQHNLSVAIYQGLSEYCRKLQKEGLPPVGMTE
ncbi:N-acetylmuramoyl-L-alanine amidase [Desulfitobacterium dichloroeliminans LMG P-21439]|uniref:N-acetylmuramoyl-L-alanine amidase n=1 Tax=Desulfitobacterium dichloroeliminans (strain LMG P-21439 / DCA1) TaxID=871963 RepID=L0F4J1_DESDL|nr:N-acetylmuramoyl-L-alanine amidase [Desulfitobacterium dichloroeliminans]AGA68082.1 N-acetylmuramoyl-L-alanine amidase [Desulfitobacterium dichloroeliminans LMG P-21439]